MEEQKVYVVTKGSYSDYHICRIFLDKKKAEKYKESISDSSYDGKADVEEYVLGEENQDWVFGWYVHRSINCGERRDIEKGKAYWSARCLGEIDESQGDDYYYASDSFNVINDVFCVDSHGWTFHFRAPNEEAALKIANERYMRVQIEQDVTHRFEMNTYYNYNNFNKVE